MKIHQAGGCTIQSYYKPELITNTNCSHAGKTACGILTVWNHDKGSDCDEIAVL